MKHILTILLLTITTAFFAQKYETKKGFVAGGYDVVSYFDNKAKKGDKKYTTEYDGVKFKFSSAENLQKFKKSPEKYIPQYGGHCAYAIGEKSRLMSCNPKAFEVRDGKLYLFYKSWFNNTLKKWKKNNPEKLKEKADKNWKVVEEN